MVGEFDQGRTAFFDEPMRRASQAFREQQDVGLTCAFNLSVSALWAFAVPDSRPQLLRASLQCFLSCLSFDFAGTGADESTLGTACVYLPKAWVAQAASGEVVRRLFSLYVAIWNRAPHADLTEAANVLLQCLVLIAGTRRTVHDEESRSAFLSALMEGTMTLVQTRVGFDQSEACVHQTCRLVARSKINAQLTELAAHARFSQWLLAVCNFTCDALRAWLTVSPRSVSYLLEFWQSLVAPLPYLRSAAMNPFQDSLGLGSATVAVFDAWVQSRTAMADAAASGSDAVPEMPLRAARETGLAPRQGAAHLVDTSEVDPLVSEDAFLDDVTLVLSLARFRYPSAAEVIGRACLDALADMEQPALRARASARCAVVMYLVGALVGGPHTQQRDSATSVSLMDELNTELAAVGFKVLLSEVRPRGFALEMAVLYFLQCFQYHLIESRTRAQAHKQDVRAMQRRRHWPLQIADDASLPGLVRWGGVTAAPGGSGGGGGGQIHVRLASLPSSPSSSSLVGLADADDVPEVTFVARPVRSFESETPFSVEGDGDDIPSLLPSERQQQQQPHVIVDELDAMEAGGGGGGGGGGGEFASDYARVRASTVHQTVTERLGIAGGDRALLDIALRQVFAVLDPGRAEELGGDEQVMLVERSLGVMRRLAQGSSIMHTGAQFSPRLVSSGVLLLESPFIQDLLVNPNPARFPLLQQKRHLRSRSFFMGTLAGLLFFSMDNQQLPGTDGLMAVLGAEQSEDRFVRFMQPLTNLCDALLMALDLGDLSEPKWPLVALLRDLRGVSNAADESRHYIMLFQWLFPNRFALLVKAAERYWDDTDVSVALLRFLGELVANRGSRIAFPVSSSGGQVLLVEAARCLLAWCRPHVQRLKERLARDNGVVADDGLSFARLRELVEQMSSEKEPATGIELRPGATGAGVTLDWSTVEMKCISMASAALTRMILGRFGNLSVFDLYKDTSLKDARACALELSLACTPEHVAGFPKAEMATVTLLHNVSETAPLELVALSTPMFARMMAVLASAVSRPQNVLLSTPAAFCIETLSVLRCKAMLYVKSGLDFRSIPSGAVQLRKEGFVPSVLGAQGAGITSSKIVSARDLHELAGRFTQHDREQPELFASVMWLLLDRILLAPDHELPNLYAVARPVSVLHCCAPGALRVFATRFVQAQAADRRAAVAEKMDALVATLGGQGEGDIPDVLHRHEELTKDLCKFVRRWREAAN